jgi:RNA polymerase sigma factor (sigma-70 family)
MASRQIEALLDPPPAHSGAPGALGQSDGQLLARFAAQRDEPAEAAFTILVRRHGPMVLRVCEQILGDRHAAEDAFQVTFLVLARRARAIRQPELLGHWLHGVALRTAREVRMQRLRMKDREAAKARETILDPLVAPGPELQIVCREELEILHEEVARLPERYRGLVVLCEIEGMSYHEAATRLRCPIGTIGVRLKRARERLRERLIRRGVVPSAGLLAALLWTDDAAASVPPVLVESTVQAAMGFTAGQAAATGVVSAAVAAASEAVLWTMALARLKLAVVVAVTLAIGGALAWIAVHHQDSRQPSGAAQVVIPVVADLPRADAFEPSSPSPSAKPEPRVEPVNSVKRPGSLLFGRRSLWPVRAELFDLFPMTALVLAQPARGDIRATITLAKTEPPTAKLSAAAEIVGHSARVERARGEMLFAREWVPHDRMAKDGDGLGPLYNETSCMACHGLGSPGGAGPESKNVVLVTATSNTRRPPKSLDQIHPGLRNSRSAVIHRYGTDPDYAAWRQRFYNSSAQSVQNSCGNRSLDPVEARIQAISAQTSRIGRARGRVVHLNANAGGINLTLSERNTPALFGTGRIDAIPAEVLVMTAQSQPAPTRGRVSRDRQGRIGRFGWKAQVASLHEFVRGACANELGLEVPGHSQPTSPVASKAKVKGLDMTDADCDALVAYVRALPPPVVIDPDGPLGNREARQGRHLFADVGCTACHVPSLGDVSGIYSDLLLHDMGPSLGDSASSYGMQGPSSSPGSIVQEWRTPPLWGYRDSGPYLHDGRAENLEEAVALHDGQAKASARMFFTLSSEDRSTVEAFLKSLVAPSGSRVEGIVQAAELETRLQIEAQDAPESVIRHRREEALARGRKQRIAAQRRKQVLDAAARARVRLPLAQALEKMGKTAGALDYYRQIASDAPDSDEGRLASARIAAIGSKSDSP